MEGKTFQTKTPDKTPGQNPHKLRQTPVKTYVCMHVCILYCIVLYLCIYIALLAVHTNQKRFQCERPREKRAVLRERKEALEGVGYVLQNLYKSRIIPGKLIQTFLVFIDELCHDCHYTGDGTSSPSYCETIGGVTSSSAGAYVKTHVCRRRSTVA